MHSLEHISNRAGRRWAWMSAALLIVAGGCRDNPVDPGDRVSTIEIVSPDLSAPHFMVGDSIAVQVVAEDGEGNPVVGAALTFQITNGEGTFAQSEVITDGSGVARVTYVPGGSGQNAIEVEASGLMSPALFVFPTWPRLQVSFGMDSVKLPGVGCDTILFAQVLDDGELMRGSSVSFTATDGEVIESRAVETATGSTRGMLDWVFARKPGATDLIATHESGAADTVAIEVGTAATCS